MSGAFRHDGGATEWVKNRGGRVLFRHRPPYIFARSRGSCDNLFHLTPEMSCEQTATREERRSHGEASTTRHNVPGQEAR